VVELPVDLATLELHEPVWRRWLSFDPVELLSGAEAGRHAEALGKLSLLYFEAGRRDQFNLDFGARRLARRLTALKIDHVHEEFEDDHYSTSYRFDVSFPRLFAALSEGG